MALKKKPYGNEYPSAARYLIKEGVMGPPRQSETSLNWAEGVDITYTLKEMTPLNFSKYVDEMLLLVLQECERYKEVKWKFAGFDVKLGRLSKGRDLPEIATFGAAMHENPKVMVYGEKELGYEVPQKYFLINKVADILDLTKRYRGKINQQNPYKVIRLWVKVREERPEY